MCSSGLRHGQWLIHHEVVRMIGYVSMPQVDDGKGLISMVVEERCGVYLVVSFYLLPADRCYKN